jgi:hypothetical protein
VPPLTLLDFYGALDFKGHGADGEVRVATYLAP